MSDRDKKLLIYLGAALILAAAYFLIGRPLLDKVSILEADKIQLQSVLTQKKSAFEMQDQYLQGIEDAKAEIEKIIAKFPEDNSDEKTLMFLSEVEKKVTVWIDQVKFAEYTEGLLIPDESAAETEAAQTEAVAEQAAADGEITSDEGLENGSEETANYKNFIGKNTEIAFEFVAAYDGFRKLLNYIRDYEDRIVIKSMELKFDSEKGIIKGTIALSQYAILDSSRPVPDVEIKGVKLGKKSLFSNGEGTGKVNSLEELMNQVQAGTSSSESGTGVNYFITLSGVTKGSGGKTVGRGGDLSGESYVTSNSNSSENVYFEITGKNGTYHATYELAGKRYEDKEFSKAEGTSININISSNDRINKDDDVAITLHVKNNSDCPVNIVIGSDDADKPRVDVVEKSGSGEIKVVEK